MKVYISLLRGINVGGKNLLPMKEFAEILNFMGATHVKTYIQSGNAVFKSEPKNSTIIVSKIEREIFERKGFKTNVSLLELGEMEEAVAENPFPGTVVEPKSLHLYFLSDNPRNSDLGKAEIMKTQFEQCVLIGKIFYLHAPDGIGRSKLASNVERLMGVQATARNWRTVSKVLSLAQELSGAHKINEGCVSK